MENGRQQSTSIAPGLYCSLHLPFTLLLLTSLNCKSDYRNNHLNLLTAAINIQKRRLRTQVSNKVLLTQQVSAVLMNKLLPKRKDPGAPIISCVIRDLAIERALLDLGAS